VSLDHRRATVVALVAATLATGLLGRALIRAQDPDDRGDLQIGAFVASVGPNSTRQTSALLAAEHRLGRRLDIVQSFHSWTDPFPSAFDRYVVGRGSTLLLSWAGTDTTRILAGADDAMIADRAAALAALHRPVLLRWRWEMNRPNLAEEVGTPERYVATWRHLRAVFAAAGADNVSWVWCPLARDFASTGPAYFPGDDQVDWLCTDAYALDPRESLAPQLAPVLSWARAHPQPVMIGEFGTTRGAPGQRARWLRGVEDYVHSHPSIRAVLYFDADAPAGQFALDDEDDAWQAFADWLHGA
jgi:hypothetical protein